MRFEPREYPEQFQKAKLAFEEKLTAAGAAGEIAYSIVRPTAFFKSVSGQLEVRSRVAVAVSGVLHRLQGHFPLKSPPSLSSRGWVPREGVESIMYTGFLLLRGDIARGCCCRLTSWKFVTPDLCCPRGVEGARCLVVGMPS